MTHYRRIYTPGATWFCARSQTPVWECSLGSSSFLPSLTKLELRVLGSQAGAWEPAQNNRLLVENIDVLRTAFYDVKKKHPFRIEAAVIMPDPLYCLWTLPPGDANYSMRWGQIKGRFSSHIDSGESISKSRKKRRERGLWQRRFWTHLITDQDDFNRHVDYIHWNPVKHGWVSQVADWPHSSFFKFVKMGVYPMTWGHSGEFDFDAGE